MCAARSRIFISYWDWFLRGSGADPGYRRVVNRYLVVCILIGSGLAVAVDYTIAKAASIALLPLAGIFIGVAFAWGSNALSLLQTEELSKIAEKHPGGFPEYVYTHQTAIMVVFVALVGWGLAGLGVIDSYLTVKGNPVAYWVCEVALYALACVALHECWQVVLGVQLMVLVRQRLQHHQKSADPVTQVTGLPKGIPRKMTLKNEGEK